MMPALLSSDCEKKIICDYDDFEALHDVSGSSCDMPREEDDCKTRLLKV